jgi:hypothetical protein
VPNPNKGNTSYANVSAIKLPDIEKRLHIPFDSLVFENEIGAGSYGKVFLGYFFPCCLFLSYQSNEVIFSVSGEERRLPSKLTIKSLMSMDSLLKLNSPCMETLINQCISLTI